MTSRPKKPVMISRLNGARNTPQSPQTGGAWQEVIPFFTFPPSARSSTRRMGSTRLSCCFFAFFFCAVDLGVKRGVSAGSVIGQPVQSLLI